MRMKITVDKEGEGGGTRTETGETRDDFRLVFPVGITLLQLHLVRPGGRAARVASERDADGAQAFARHRLDHRAHQTLLVLLREFDHASSAVESVLASVAHTNRLHKGYARNSRRNTKSTKSTSICKTIAEYVI